MSVDPALNCPTCGRPWPERQGRVCAECGQSIKLHDRWRFVGSKVQHRDCNDPTLAKFTEAGRVQRAESKQTELLEVNPNG